MAVAPWVVSDQLWQLVEPLLSVKERRFRYPGRKRLPDRQPGHVAFCGKYDTGIIRAVNIARRRERDIPLTPPRDAAEKRLCACRHPETSTSLSP
jgi:hypothetical protein